MYIAKYCVPVDRRRSRRKYCNSPATPLRPCAGSFFDSCPGAHGVDREHRILAIAYRKSRFDSTTQIVVVFAVDRGHFDVFKNQIQIFIK